MGSKRFRVWACQQQRNGVDSAVEGRPQVSEKVSSDLGELFREFLGKSDFEDAVSRLIRVRLNKWFVEVFTSEEGIHLPFEISEVFLCPGDLAVRTLERV